MWGKSVPSHMVQDDLYVLSHPRIVIMYNIYYTWPIMFNTFNMLWTLYNLRSASLGAVIMIGYY